MCWRKCDDLLRRFDTVTDRWTKLLYLCASVLYRQRRREGFWHHSDQASIFGDAKRCGFSGCWPSTSAFWRSSAAVRTPSLSEHVRPWGFSVARLIVRNALLDDLWALTCSTDSRQLPFAVENFLWSLATRCASDGVTRWRCSFVCLSVRSFVCRQKLITLELWSLLTTSRKSYMGFSKNPFSDPYIGWHRATAILVPCPTDCGGSLSCRPIGTISLYQSFAVIGTLVVDGWADWALYPAQSPPRCTKCNSPPINDQCTNFIYYSVWHYNYLCILMD